GVVQSQWGGGKGPTATHGTPARGSNPSSPHGVGQGRKQSVSWGVGRRGRAGAGTGAATSPQISGNDPWGTWAARGQGMWNPTGRVDLLNTVGSGFHGAVDSRGQGISGVRGSGSGSG
ncbi:unnamed protein product, partial [Discosporangium mesarthrocarpum]